MDRRFRWIGIALLATAAAIVVWLLFAFGVFGPGWPDDAIFVPRDVPTVREALERATPGGTIVVSARDVPYAGPIDVDVADVTLVSSRGAAILAAEGADPALAITADGVTVQGFEIASESVGIRIEATRCTIEKVRIDGAPIGLQLIDAQACALRVLEVVGGRTGIELTSSAGNLFSDITVREADDNGLKLIGSWRNRIEDLVVLDTPVGISLEQDSSENELIDCRMERTAVVGIELYGALDNRIEHGTVRTAGLGIHLDGVTGTRIDGCRITDVRIGLSMENADRNRIVENRIGPCETVGIQLAGSAENALAYNGIADCADAGIRLDGSDRNLLMGNRIDGTIVGIDSDRSTDDRLLRNVIRSSERIGIRLAGGGGHRLFDNHVSSGAWGVLLSESPENVLLRNRIERQQRVAVVIANGSGATRAAENELVGNAIGFLIHDGPRCEVLNNLVDGHDVGLWLVRAGGEIRIEGNAFEGNGIAVRQSASTDRADLEEVLGDGGDVAAPILVSNRFVGSEAFDLSNETSSPIYAEGNWWEDGEGANVSNGVDLEGSAWRGEVAIGTDASLSQELLGRILQDVLSAAGFRVIDLIGIGSDQRLRDAFRVEDVDFVWWSDRTSALTGEDVPDRGVAETTIAAVHHWVAVVPAETAQRLAEPTLSAYATRLRETGETIRLAASPAAGEATWNALASAYGLGEAIDSIDWAETLGQAETLLKLGAVDMALVGNLEETLTFSDFVRLEDDLGIFEPFELLVAFRSEVLERYPDVGALLTDLAERLTTDAIHDLNSRVRLLQRPVETVAREYLVGQGLLGE